VLKHEVFGKPGVEDEVLKYAALKSAARRLAAVRAAIDEGLVSPEAGDVPGAEAFARLRDACFGVGVSPLRLRK
jgi:hypothetical protein